ncbi:MAG: toxic anion resistance protein [Paracoccaceae bacterium]
MTTTPARPTDVAGPPASAELEEAIAPTPEVRQEVVPIDMADPEERAEIERRMAELDLFDTTSIVTFGSQAQEKLTEISDTMLEGVRNKDTGPAGETLREMVSTLRGFELSELDPGAKRGWWDRLLGRMHPVAKFIAQYETVRGQIDGITDSLLRHETVLLKDIKFLDKLYAETLRFYDEIGLYIAAGEARISRLDVFEIPELEKRTASEDDAMAGQELRDLRAARDELERRIHDMRLTRQVTMQSLPSIRLVQENDKALVAKINSTLVNTVPLWRQQLAQAVTIARSRDAAAATRQATDLTNELLTKNAENLRQANREVREEMERGVFDIENVRQANDTLIATIEDSLQIADQGRARRAAAEEELQQMEADLKATLSAARAGTAEREGAGEARTRR